MIQEEKISRKAEMSHGTPAAFCIADTNRVIPLEKKGISERLGCYGIKQEVRTTNKSMKNYMVADNGNKVKLRR